jgi:hypothetical protein
MVWIIGVLLVFVVGYYLNAYNDYTHYKTIKGIDQTITFKQYVKMQSEQCFDTYF